VDKHRLRCRTRGNPFLHMLFWGSECVSPHSGARYLASSDSEFLYFFFCFFSKPICCVWVVCLVACDFENVRLWSYEVDSRTITKSYPSIILDIAISCGLLDVAPQSLAWKMIWVHKQRCEEKPRIYP
jgi:hypothetical protein